MISTGDDCKGTLGTIFRHCVYRFGIADMIML